MQTDEDVCEKKEEIYNVDSNFATLCTLPPTLMKRVLNYHCFDVVWQENKPSAFGSKLIIKLTS